MNIAGYGAAAKTTTFLNYFKISEKNIKFICDDNKLKQGKFLPGVKIRIKSKQNLNGKPDCLIVLAWNFFDEIKKNNSDLADKFVSIKELEK